MKYVLTGGAGHITKPLAEKLLNDGHQVIIIGRNAENLKPLTDKGVKAAIGSVEDKAFLAETFKGADAVYTMVPPKWDAQDWKAWIGKIGQNYADAIKEAGVKHVVNLSSVGAHQPDGVGPVSGLHRVEEALNAAPGVSVKHLRPAYFYLNLLANIPMVKGMNILGANYGEADQTILMVHPRDIAAVAAEELESLSFSGHPVRYIVGDERALSEVAKTLGEAVGKPDLKWVNFSDADAANGMKGAGLSEEVAKNYAEMGAAMRTGTMDEDYRKHPVSSFAPTKLTDFAEEFAAAYNAS